MKMSKNKIEKIKERINAQIESIKANELYPSYCLNGHVSGLENALTIIEDIEPDIKIPLYKSEHVKLSIVGDIK